MMRKKLGFFGTQSEDAVIAEDLLSWMQKHKADYTNTFCLLGAGSLPKDGKYTDPTFTNWYVRWKARLAQQSETTNESLNLMFAANPTYIPRNHKVEDALSSASENGDLAKIHLLIDVITKPYIERNGLKTYTEPRPSDYSPYQTFCGT